MKEAVSTRRDGLIAIYTPRTENTYRRFVAFHVVSFVATGMATQQHILGNIIRVALLYKESILHVACRMVGSEVEHRKDMLVIINLRTLVQGEAHTRKNIDNLVFHNGQRVART